MDLSQRVSRDVVRRVVAAQELDTRQTTGVIYWEGSQFVDWSKGPRAGGGGQGYVEVRSAWIWCEVCGGLGRLMTPKAQLLLRGRVEEKFPGAAVQAPTLVLA